MTTARSGTGAATRSEGAQGLSLKKQPQALQPLGQVIDETDEQMDGGASASEGAPLNKF